jgi:hypothetical protein
MSKTVNLKMAKTDVSTMRNQSDWCMGRYQGATEGSGVSIFFTSDSITLLHRAIAMLFRLRCTCFIYTFYLGWLLNLYT